MKNYVFFVAKIEKKDDKAPEWVKIITKGEWKNSKSSRKFKISEKECLEIISNFEADPRGETVFDYEHQTIYGVEAPAAGWIKQLEYREDGYIWARVEWTARAEQYIISKEYKYTSWVILFGATDEHGNKIGTWLHSVALTNTPHIRELPGVAAKLDIFCSKGGSEMNKDLLKLLGLSETASESEALAAVTKLKTEADTAFAAVTGIKAQLGLTGDASISSAIEGLKKHDGFVAASMYNQAMTQIAALEEKLKSVATSEVQALVNDAIENKKIILPAQKDWALNYASQDLEGFKKFVASASPVLSTDKVDDKEETGVSAAKKLTAEETAVCKQLGLSAEDYVKYNK